MQSNRLEPDENIRRSYNRLASTYNQRWASYVMKSTDEVLGRLTMIGDEKILDVGCGTGFLLRRLAERWPRLSLTGADISEKMLEQARSESPSKIAYHQASAELLPFASASFDQVVSISSFHYWRQPEQALSEIRRVLKPAGTIVISDWCHDYLTCKACHFYLKVFDPAHHKTYGVTDLSRFLSHAGFTNIRTAKYKINWLWGMMTAIGCKTL